MIIDTTIVDAYLNSDDVSVFSSMWLYSEEAEEGVANIFSMPPDVEIKREAVSQIKEAIISHAASFKPCNTPIWNALFDNWHEFLENTTLDLIVGYPDTHDAVVRKAPDGSHHMIFDLLCWEKYLGWMPLSAIAQNLLTHELFHVMVGTVFSGIEQAEGCGSYIEQLDAITFDEGFAHLVSYKQQEVDAVPWDGEKFEDIYDNSTHKMNSALQEINSDKQEQYIYEAHFGNYYDKYAAMCGMIYLGRQWQRGGAERLKEIFYQGYRDFAAKSIVR